MKDYALQCENISKSFPGVQALDNVDFDLFKGEIHALCGENGAGKSTLIKIITGLYQKDSGTIIYNGKEVNYKGTTECRSHGIALIPQELQMSETLSVAENVFMAGFPKKGILVDWKKMRDDTRELQRKLGAAAMAFDPEDRVSTLSMGQRQLVEIMKAISTGVELIAFDEPTSSLSDEETSEMFKLIRELTTKGISVIYVSHRLAEIFEIADRVTVFKDGKYVGTKEINQTSTPEIISMMVGREMDLYQRKLEGRDAGEAVLEVKGLTRGNKVRDVSFSVHRGEILGMFGIVGSGRTETVRLLFGLDEMDKGEMFLHGQPLAIKSPADAVSRKIGFITEDRRGEGLSLVLNVTQNITMPYFKKFKKRGLLRLNEEAKVAEEMVDMLSIKTPGLRTRVETLSGGNQQKIVIAKWLGADSELLIFDEPTRGIDVGAKAEIHKLIDDLSNDGKAIIMISSELPEILAMSDRVLVFRDGEIKANLANTETLTEEDILSYSIKTQ
jgi:ribose transport system ATP-binding protein